MTGFIAFLLLFQQGHRDSVGTKALQEVVVRAGRLQVFEGDRVASWSLESTKGLLIQAGRPAAARFAGLPGVQFTDRENPSTGERLTMRGAGWRSNFGVRGVHVRYNGFPLTMPDGQTVLSAVDPDLVSRIDVSPASSGMFWGSGLGGVLALSDLDSRNEAALAAGAFGYRKVTVRQSFTGNQASTFIRLSGLESDGWRDNSRARIARFSFTRSQQLTRRARIQVSVHGEEAPLLENPGALDLAGFNTTPRAANARNALLNARKESRQGLAGVMVQQGTLSAGVWGLRRALFNPLAFARIELDRRAGGFFVHQSGSSGAWTWQTGADAALQNDSRLEFLSEGTSYRAEPAVNQREIFVNAGLFARAAYSVAPGGTEVSGGVRLQRNGLDARPAAGFDDIRGARTFTVLLPSVQVTVPVQTVAFSRAFAALHTSFEPPTLNESSAPADPGTRALLPERGLTFEAGLYGAGTGSFSPESTGPVQAASRFSGFISRFDRAIEAYESAASPGEIRYRNRGKTLHAGLDHTISLRADQVEAAQSIQVGIYRFLDGPEKGKEIPALPLLQLHTRLDWHEGPNSAGITAQVQSRRFADSPNVRRIESAIAISVTGSRVLAKRGRKETRFFVSALNLLQNKSPAGIIVNASGGRYYEPAAPASFRMGITASW